MRLTIFSLMPLLFGWFTTQSHPVLPVENRLLSQDTVVIPGQALLTATLNGHVREKATGEHLPCNVVIKDSSGKAYWPDSTYVWYSFVNGVYAEFPSEGSFTIQNLPYGRYTYEIDRGPEFTQATGSFMLDRPVMSLDFTLDRIVDMKTRNWWSGETHVHRKLQHIPLLMQASDLHFAAVNTSWNERNSPFPADSILRPHSFDTNRFYSLTAAEDERNGGAILYLNSSRPVNFGKLSDEYPSMVQVLEQVASSHPDAWIDLEKPFWWDLPFFLSTGKVQSVGIVHNHMNKRSMLDGEYMGRPRDREQYPGPNGNAYWSQELYYHILNTGLRIPPSAGSASGVLPTSVGYNRMYAYVEGQPGYSTWWNAVEKGNLFVSNGPLLDCRADDRLPGYIFSSKKKKMNIRIRSALYSRDSIESVEIIKNGKIYATIPPADIRDGLIQTAVPFDQSGWFLVRVIAKNPLTFRFASTAPYYVEIGKDKKRISRSSAQYLLDWARLRASKISLDDPVQQSQVSRSIHEGLAYWENMVRNANAE